jgi:penicillin-binding protein 1C
VLQDSLIARESNGAVFQPQNPSVNSYQGNISLRNALGNSLNVPAFKTAAIVGVDNVVEQARKMGFSTLDSRTGLRSIGGVDLALGDLVAIRSSRTAA